MKIMIEDLEKSLLYSEELGVRLDKGETEIFKCVLASFLHGGLISETIASKTFAFVRIETCLIRLRRYVR